MSVVKKRSGDGGALLCGEGKGKANPLEALTGPEGSRRLILFKVEASYLLLIKIG